LLWWNGDVSNVLKELSFVHVLERVQRSAQVMKGKSPCE